MERDLGNETMGGEGGEEGSGGEGKLVDQCKEWTLQKN